MTSKGRGPFFSWMRLIGAFGLCAGLFGLPEGAGAKEFWFEAHELGKGRGPSKWEKRKSGCRPPWSLTRKQISMNPYGLSSQIRPALTTNSRWGAFHAST
jgi:hypothetical protein